jgi:hypothetical protein
MQNWVKNGHIFKPDGSVEWMQSHAQVPVADVLNDDITRIYFASRDNNNRSRIGYIEVETENPKNIIKLNKNPILDIGKIGTFDDCGVMPSWIVNYDNKKYLFYIGWTVRNTIPYHNSIGLAISEDNGKTFKKFSEGPLFSPTYKEPYFTGTSCVIRDDGIWKNWYLSCTKWEVINGKPEPFYNIKYAESKNGIDWTRNAEISIDYKSSEEGGIVKASVIKEHNKYKMWYSYRKKENYRQNKDNSYRIGYAESKDGINWERMDSEVTLGLSESGWDSEMLCYPHVIQYKKNKVLFYNGNGFGKSGFGYAILR